MLACYAAGLWLVRLPCTQRLRRHFTATKRPSRKQIVSKLAPDGFAQPSTPKLTLAARVMSFRNPLLAHGPADDPAFDNLALSDPAPGVRVSILPLKQRVIGCVLYWFLFVRTRASLFWAGCRECEC